MYTNKESFAYWQSKLQNIQPIQNPIAIKIKNIKVSEGHFTFTIPETSLTILLSALATVIHRYSLQEEFVIGAISKKHFGELLALPISIKIHNKDKISDIIDQIEKEIAISTENTNISLQDLSDILPRNPEFSSGSFFQFLLGFEISSPNLASINFNVQNKNQIKITYSTELFESEAIARLAGHYQTILKQILEISDVTIENLQLLTEAEYQHIAIQWNQTQTDFPDKSGLHQLFETNEKKAPKAPAIFFNNQIITYRELNEKANQLAHHLKTMGISPQVPVGLYMEHSVELVIGILGILKAGGAYVPLDPNYPRDRINFMLADSKVSTIVTMKYLDKISSGINGEKIYLDSEWNKISKYPINQPKSSVTPENLAYIIYTSGSTGTPKGITLRHSGVVNNLIDLNTSYNIGPNSRILAISSLSFDMCVYEILGSLASGGAIVMPDPKLAKEPAHWAEIVQRHRVTVWNSAPQMLKMFVDYAEATPSVDPSSIRTVILGGDWVPVSLPNRLRTLSPKAKVIVLGGATEASIHSITYPIKEINPTWSSIPYGKPMLNQKAYIIDPNFNLLPIGIPGELCLGGIGLAHGYFEHPGMTSEKFIPNPFTNNSGDRIYRTGDLAQYLPDGNIQLLGRIDHLVKIRGNRIELEEIKTKLNEHPMIQETVIHAKEDRIGEKFLAAYLVLKEQNGIINKGKSEVIDQWQAIYDETYNLPPTSDDPKRNYAGWVNSYDGAAFSESEMEDIIEKSIEKILDLNPKKVLEIGCGIGLILLRVAPSCEKYVGTDLSNSAINNLKTQLDNQKDLAHIQLIQRTAEYLNEDEKQKYDTVIINSVSQHFPDIQYAMTVIQQAVHATQDSGHIFIGDIRNLPLMEAFHTSIEVFRANNDTNTKSIKEAIQKRRQQEKELFLDPAFFYALKEINPRIVEISLSLKESHHNNEIINYHFDAVIKVGTQKSKPTQVNWQDCLENKLSIKDIQKKLENAPKKNHGFSNITNTRLSETLAIVEAINSSNLPPNKLALNTIESSQMGIDPHDLKVLGEKLGFSTELSVSLDQKNIGVFEAVFWSEETALFANKDSWLKEPPAPKNWSHYANVPMKSYQETKNINAQLRSHLKKTLPDYMIPSYFIVLDKFPLSPNGKIDYSALPNPERVRPIMNSKYKKPSNPIETILCGIWEDTMDIHKIGVDDDFFELGGHSLLATQIVTSIRNTLQVIISLRILFEESTIIKLAKRLEIIGKEKNVDINEIADMVIMISEMSDEKVESMLSKY